MNRLRRLFIVALIAVFNVAVFSPGAVQAQKAQKLVMGYPTPGAGITVEVMRRAGFFKKYSHDVDLVLLSGSSLLTTAMISGNVPVSMVGAAPMVVAAVAGADTVLLACATTYAYGRLFASAKIASIAGLKGKRVGLTRLGTIDDGILRYVFRERGLNPERDVTFIAAGSGAERLVSLSNGAIDAAIFRAPHDGFAEKAGFSEILDINKAGLYNPASCIGTTKSYARNHRDSALRLVKGFVEGLKFFKENREFAFKVAAEFTRTNDPEAISAVLDSPARLQEKIPYVPLKGIDFLLKVEALRNPRAAGFDPTSVIDSSFLQELEKGGFIEALWKK
ncbi:MAG: ABC transporter substrate-binding protein [Candidatus Binatota bacterium]|nr:ABC transporter substrate-binding protein [Candidatus Binatota bacterium]